MIGNRWILFILVVALLTLGSEVVRLRQIVNHTGLVFLVFRVIDAESQTPILDYALSLPETGNRTFRFPREMSLLRGADFSLVFAIARKPATFGFSANGYEKRSIEISPKSYDTSNGSLPPADIQTISLSKSLNR
jgi:hypothetical protein